MTNQELKKIISELKNHVNILGYHLHKLSSTKGKDLHIRTAKVAHKHMDDIFNKKIPDLEKHLTAKIEEHEMRKRAKRDQKNLDKEGSKTKTAYERGREAILNYDIKKRQDKNS